MAFYKFSDEAVYAFDSVETLEHFNHRRGEAE